MSFGTILGQEHLKKHIKSCFKHNRIPHAQLFVGANGHGTLAMALATADLILNSDPNHQIYSSVLAHPDFHVAIPVNSVNGKPSKPSTSDFLPQWKKQIHQNPYLDLKTWYTSIGIEKKRGIMSVNEADRIAKELTLKPYAGVAKVMIIWCADTMHTAAFNKLLKIIEEPPNNTYLILTTEKEELILDTIKSRCQSLYFPKLSQNTIREFLVSRYHIEQSKADFIAQQASGDYIKAIDHLQSNEEYIVFENFFIEWLRLAFMAKKNKSVLKNLTDWSTEIANYSREKQIRFLQYCLHFFRQAFLKNYKVDDLVYLHTNSNFSFENFSNFIHGNNIEDIYKTLQEAIYHIERNVNSKMIMTDTSIKLTRFIHRKA